MCLKWVGTQVESVLGKAFGLLRDENKINSVALVETKLLRFECDPQNSLTEFWLCFHRVTVVYKRRDTKFDSKYMVFGSKTPEGDHFKIKVGFYDKISDS